MKKFAPIGIQVLVASAFAASAVPALADAASAKMVKPAAMSCEDFLAFDDVTRPEIVYWSEGLTRKGKPEDAVFDVERTNRLVPILVEDCTKEPKASYYKKVKDAVKKAS
jgi:Na+/serine symporter